MDYGIVGPSILPMKLLHSSQREQDVILCSWRLVHSTSCTLAWFVCTFGNLSFHFIIQMSIRDQSFTNLLRSHPWALPLVTTTKLYILVVDLDASYNSGFSWVVWLHYDQSQSLLKKETQKPSSFFPNFLFRRLPWESMIVFFPLDGVSRWLASWRIGLGHHIHVNKQKREQWLGLMFRLALQTTTCAPWFSRCIL
jgi:hypothetical protein